MKSKSDKTAKTKPHKDKDKNKSDKHHHTKEKSKEKGKKHKSKPDKIASNVTLTETRVQSSAELPLQTEKKTEFVLSQQLFSALFSQHPWHGASPGDNLPETVTSYIEIVPTDTVKYELDKNSGLLKIDRPHRFSNVCPSLYGFIPQTYCGKNVAQRCCEITGKKDIVGDGDPLDICVLSSKVITHGDILVHCIPIGGFRMLDGNEADDKIIAVLENDPVYGGYRDLTECPKQLIDPLRHYFLTYKQIPSSNEVVKVEISDLYDRKEAHEVIRRSVQDYIESFGSPDERIEQLSNLLAVHIRK